MLYPLTLVRLVHLRAQAQARLVQDQDQAQAQAAQRVLQAQPALQEHLEKAAQPALVVQRVQQVPLGPRVLPARLALPEPRARAALRVQLAKVARPALVAKW